MRNGTKTKTVINREKKDSQLGIEKKGPWVRWQKQRGRKDKSGHGGNNETWTGKEKRRRFKTEGVHRSPREPFPPESKGQTNVGNGTVQKVSSQLWGGGSTMEMGG